MKSLFKFAFILSLVGLTACSGPTRKPQEQAIYNAMVNDAAFRKIADGCSKLGDRLAQDAWRARKEWWERNRALVEGADYGFSYNMITINGDRQETSARYAMAFGFDVQDAAQKQADKVLKNSNYYDACKKALEDYQAGKHELKSDEKMYSILLDLAQQRREKGKDLLLEKSKVQVKAGYTYSRSSMTAEQLAKRHACPGAVVNTLKAAWPTEVFEAVCPDNSLILIQCEWGQCKVKE